MLGAIIIEGHVQGLSNTRALGEQGIPVWIIDKTNCIAQYSKYCQKFIKCPDFQSEEFTPFLIELAIRENIKDWLLIPSNDHAVVAIAKNKEKLSDFYRFVVSDLSIIEKIYDKGNLLAVAKKVNVPFPKTQFFHSSDELLSTEIEFPVLTKGRTGLTFYKSLKKKAFLANNADELKEQLKIISRKIPLNQTFTQELIPFDGKNKTISFTAFCVDGEIKTHWSGVKLREHPIQFGTATFTQSVSVKELFDQSTKILSELNYSGICEVEFLFDPRDKQHKLIEINARSWLWVGLAKKCGVNYAKILYDFVNNKSIDYPRSYKLGEYWINPLTDFIYSWIGIINGKVKMKDYFKTLFFAKKNNALFEKGDWKPGFMYFMKTIDFINKR
jgi:predicted ATP-grasp superfamily ATP-dependent carboligase